MAVSLCNTCNVIVTDREARNGYCDSCLPAGMTANATPVAVNVPQSMETQKTAEAGPPSQLLVAARVAVISLLTFAAVFFSTYQKDGKDLLGVEYAAFSNEMQIGDQVVEGRTARSRNKIALLNTFLTAHTFVLAVIVAVFTLIGLGMKSISRQQNDDSLVPALSYLAAFIAGTVIAIMASNPLGGQFQYIIVGLVVFGGMTALVDQLKDKKEEEAQKAAADKIRAIIAQVSR